MCADQTVSAGIRRSNQNGETYQYQHSTPWRATIHRAPTFAHRRKVQTHYRHIARPQQDRILDPQEKAFAYNYTKSYHQAMGRVTEWMLNRKSAPQTTNTKFKYPFSSNQMVEIIRAEWYDGVPWWVNDELVDTLLVRVAVAAVYRPKNQELWVHQSNVHYGSFIHYLTRMLGIIWGRPAKDVLRWAEETAPSFATESCVFA
ncbi:hypothetical protein LTR17_016455 [Elasticomyces elasticus]|nr:hypothetical protein LTR17_016455 [Elasticomyces elasticus]